MTIREGEDAKFSSSLSVNPEMRLVALCCRRSRAADASDLTKGADSDFATKVARSRCRVNRSHLLSDRRERRGYAPFQVHRINPQAISDDSWGKALYAPHGLLR
jgi:hypothetical protein